MPLQKYKNSPRKNNGKIPKKKKMRELKEKKKKHESERDANG